MVWHALSCEEVFNKLATSPSGLTEEEAKKRLHLYGANAIRPPSTAQPLQILIRQLNNPIVYLLLFATLISTLLGRLSDATVVFAVVVLNTLIGFLQEYKAHKVIKSLSTLIPHEIHLIRQGELKKRAPEVLVPGDVVVLEAGDKIPADIRLFYTKNFQCEESMLTGESLPARKDERELDSEMHLAERKCMAYMGTYVTTGVARGVVVESGGKTEFGKISHLLEEVEVIDTPLMRALKKVAQGVTLIVFAISFVLFLVAYVRGSSLFDAAFTAVALSVAAIPEGLPAVITITASLGVRRMAKRKAIIRELPAVEALGSTSVICTDKTGTLTYNEMTVQKVWTQAGSAFVSGVGYSLEGSFQEPFSRGEVRELLEAAIVASDASIGEQRFLGDPTEIALLVAGKKLGLDEKEVRERWKREDVIPFEPETRVMLVLSRSTLLMKGAPEEVMAKCTLVDEKGIKEEIERMAREGMRVLAVAKKESARSTIDPSEQGFRLLGLIGMIDPPRKEVLSALKTCFKAGITVKMITGDHPITAEAIGRELGIASKEGVITGREMDHFSQEEWRLKPSTYNVFARASPEHKLKIVQSLQAHNQVVAMTGDGVNDAAALKRADIGVAMGIKGTSVAKEAADMVLADDNFVSIEAAVEEGRRVYDNLIKSLIFLIPTNLSQALVVFFAILFFPMKEGRQLYPIQPVQILWVNLVVAIALSLTLAFEPAEKDLMTRPPRKKGAPLIGRREFLSALATALLFAIGTIALFLWMHQRESLAKAQTVAVTALILFQVIFLFRCRRGTPFFSNPYIFIGIGAVIIAQLAFIYLPFMQKVFHSAAL